MEASSSCFRPPTYVNRWVSQGLSSLESEGEIIEISQSPSIFRLPKHITRTNPEAYTPHLLGLGPYHHFRHEFHVTDRLKRAILKEFINHHNSSTRDLVGKMKKLEMAVRASYCEYLDLTESTLAYIIVVDSFFLLYYLRRSTTEDDDDDDDKFIKRLHDEFSKDVFMLENQIPAEALAHMGTELSVLPNNANNKDTKLYALFYDLCREHSPLKLSEQLEDKNNNKSTHLLAHMYNLIVCNRARNGDIIFYDAEEEANDGEMKFVDDLRPIFTAAFQLLTPIVQQTCFQLTFIGRVLNVVTKVNLANIVSEKQAQTGGFHIPSVSTLSEKFKVDFKLNRGGIRDIRFQEDAGELDQIKKNQKTPGPTLYLPEITLGYNSEVILRNLVAYETAIATPESTFELTHYVDLMCSIVSTPKDVQLLRENGIMIIKGSLGNEEVAKMFNGISSCISSSKSSSVKSESLMAGEEVNKMVEKWENKKLWRRVFNFWSRKKITLNTVIYVAYWYVGVQVVLEMVNKYCQLYGCSKEVGQITGILSWVSNYMFSS